MQKLIYVFVLVAFFSCDKSPDPIEVSESSLKNKLFKENVALVDARVRAVDTEHFVKEYVVTDFSKAHVLGEAFVFEDMGYIDNGQEFDLTAGDGVFTAVRKSQYNERVRAGSLTGAQPKSVSNGVIIDEAFKKSAELDRFQLQYFKDSPTTPNARRPIYACHVEFGGTGCYAYKWDLCSNCCVIITCSVGYSND